MVAPHWVFMRFAFNFIMLNRINTEITKRKSQSISMAARQKSERKNREEEKFPIKGLSSPQKCIQLARKAATMCLGVCVYVCADFICSHRVKIHIIYIFFGICCCSNFLTLSLNILFSILEYFFLSFVLLNPVT